MAKETIENLLWVKQMHFPEEPLDWDRLLDKFAQSSYFSFVDTFQERMRFLFMCGMPSCLEALPFKIWHDHIRNLFEWRFDNSTILHGIREKLAHFEGEFPILKEATITLELALWKLRMTVNKNIHQKVLRLPGESQN
jgi:hypothetical protein